MGRLPCSAAGSEEAWAGVGRGGEEEAPPWAEQWACLHPKRGHNRHVLEKMVELGLVFRPHLREQEEGRLPITWAHRPAVSASARPRRQQCLVSGPE